MTLKNMMNYFQNLYYAYVVVCVIIWIRKMLLSVIFSEFLVVAVILSLTKLLCQQFVFSILDVERDCHTGERCFDYKNES